MIKDIVLICDDNYCMPTAVCIKSITDNAHIEVPVLIHVCTFGLTNENVALLEGLSTLNYKIVVDVFNPTIISGKLTQVIAKSHVTQSALIKFELPNIFHNIDSLLYIDSDIIINSDINELVSIEIEEYYLAASYEFWKHVAKMKFTFKHDVDKDFYFNSGVMLMNLRKMREDKISEKLWYFKLNQAKTELMDQESLNYVCREAIYHLPVKWNFNPAFLHNDFIKEINIVYKTTYSSVENMLADARIIHYVGKGDKPWVYKSARMRNLWDKEYDTIFHEKLQLKDEIDSSERRDSSKIKKIVNDFGFTGLFCYIVYRLKQLLKWK